MSKLRAPELNHPKRRRQFFKEHPELPNAEAELKRLDIMERTRQMKKIKTNFRNTFMKRKGKKIVPKGAFGQKPDYLTKKVELEVV